MQDPRQTPWSGGQATVLLAVLMLILGACGGEGGTTVTTAAGAAATTTDASSEAAETTAASESTASSDVPGTSAPAEASEPVELIMWNIPLSDSYTEFWETYVAEFNETHPNIQVTHEIFDTETLKTKIRAALLAGTEPDIWFFFPGEFTTLNHRDGKIRAIDDILPVDEYTEEGLARCTDGESVICLPLFLGPSAMYYNVALFAEAGVDPNSWADPEQPTLDEFYAAIDALKEAGITPMAVGNAENWPLMHLYWAAQNRYGGTEVLNNAVLGAEGVTYEHESFVKAGEFVQDLVARDALPEGFNGIGGDEKYALFTQGEGAMIYQGPWMIAIAEGSAPEGFEYGMFRFPRFEDGNPDSQRDIMAGLDALFVSSSTENPEAVGEFLRGFSDPETARRFMVDTNNISTVEGVADAVVDSGEAGAELLRLAEMLAESEHTYQWWDWLLSPPVAETMLDLSQPLSSGSVAPEDVATQMEESAQR